MESLISGLCTLLHSHLPSSSQNVSHKTYCNMHVAFIFLPQSMPSGAERKTPSIPSSTVPGAGSDREASRALERNHTRTIAVVPRSRIQTLTDRQPLLQFSNREFMLVQIQKKLNTGQAHGLLRPHTRYRESPKPGRRWR